MKHPLTIENYPGTLEDLTKELGNLRYDSLAVFLQALTEELHAQAVTDAQRERPQLALQLYRSSSYLEQAAKSIETAWKICRPYMKEE